MHDTLVAVYDTPAHAKLAIADLELAGIPADAVESHAGTDPNPPPEPARPGFWAAMFGSHDHPDAPALHRSLANGATVVTVRADPAYNPQAIDILESHAPVDMDERTATLGAAQPSTDPQLVNRGGARIRHFSMED